jgi:hypothetical protein
VAAGKVIGKVILEICLAEGYMRTLTMNPQSRHQSRHLETE